MAARARSDAGDWLVGFPPSVDTRCRALVLGSAPSVRSLAKREYYGHAQNQFWPFMDEIFGVRRTWSYERRLAALRRYGLAVWDVVHRCRRHASSDATIADVEPNDFATLFRDYPRIARVFFNGAKAWELFEKLVRPELPELQVAFVRMPSTSPANASIPREHKLAAWSQVRASTESQSFSR